VIHETRIAALNRAAPNGKGRYVLYWMQAAQRATCNHALELALREANARHLPLLVYFGLAERVPRANARHYAFMLEGLRETQHLLANRGTRLIVRRESPEQGVIDLARDAALAVVDKGYLRWQRAWYRYAAERLACPLIQIECNVVVPVPIASAKEEYAARTIRPKIERLLDAYLAPLYEESAIHDARGIDVASLDLEGAEAILTSLDVDRSVAPSSTWKGGESQARRLLYEFIESKLDHYAELRNEPIQDSISHLSPYLHFGQVSPLEIALAVRRAASPGGPAYLEELIVRRELAMNMVYYNPNYDAFDCLPTWAVNALRAHAGDSRLYLYERDEWEAARTHDPYWNAAQREMMITGKMHGYMRMYWGKKLLEWSRTPEEAYDTAVYLNDKYELDGRDPNGYAGIAWCFGKHDRPWDARPVYGAVRSMTAEGLKRKFDADAYVARIAALESERPLNAAS